MRKNCKFSIILLVFFLVVNISPSIVFGDDDLGYSPEKHHFEPYSKDEVNEDLAELDAMHEIITSCEEEVDRLLEESETNSDVPENVDTPKARKTLKASAGVKYISTIEELYAIRNNLSGNYVLSSDLDLKGATSSGGKYYNNGKGWTPISEFTGTFDGAGHTINGLNTKGNGTDSALFAVNKGVIKNLTLKNGTISMTLTDLTHYAGGIVGRNFGTIENCVNYNVIDLTGRYIQDAGGIAGYSSGAVINCTNYGEVNILNASQSSSLAGAGGLVGSCRGNVSGENYGDVTSASSGITFAGGIIGKNEKNEGTISDCYNEGNIIGTALGSSAICLSGGIVGDSVSNISNSQNNGSVTALSDYLAYGGGIVGSASGITIDNCSNVSAVASSCNKQGIITFGGGIAGSLLKSGAIKNSNNSGTVIVEGKSNIYSGGIAGSVAGTIDKCYNTAVVSGYCRLDKSYKVFGGGIAGSLDKDSSSVISDSYNSGTIFLFDSAENNNYGYCGGICGETTEGTSVLTSYSTGVIGSFQWSGGLVGTNAGTISDCYFAGYFSEPKGAFGGIAALNDSTGVIENVYSVGTCSAERNGMSICCYNYGNINKDVVVSDLGLLYGIYGGNSSESLYKEATINEMKSKSTFPNFDFNGKWTISSGTYSLPILRNVTDSSIQNDITIPIDRIYCELIGGNFTYDGSKHKPLPFLAGCNVYDDYTFSGAGINAGKYTLTVQGSDPIVGSVGYSFVINKAANTMKVKAKNISVSKKQLKKKNKSIKKTAAFTIKKPVGKVTFKKASGNKKITISKAGKITIKKGLKKGTYKVKVKVTAAGNKNYKKLVKTITLKIKVK